MLTLACKGSDEDAHEIEASAMLDADEAEALAEFLRDAAHAPEDLDRTPIRLEAANKT